MNHSNRLLVGTILMACTLTLPLLAASSAAVEEKGRLPLDDKSDLSPEDNKKVSEALGYYLMQNLPHNLDMDSVAKGMRDGLDHKPAPMSLSDFEATMALFQKKAHEKMAETNLKAADDFMKNNAKQKNITEIEPGKLQYEVLQQGNGAVVQENGNPQINYSGKYQDGTVFSSSADVGGPINVPLDQTIPGFSKGIAGMKEGEKRRLFIHPDLGYGKMGQLPPNSLLIFDIEIVKAEAPKNAQGEDEDIMPLSHDDEENSYDDAEHDHATTENKKK